jgi:hypothetical protein
MGRVGKTWRFNTDTVHNCQVYSVLQSRTLSTDGNSVAFSRSIPAFRLSLLTNSIRSEAAMVCPFCAPQISSVDDKFDPADLIEADLILDSAVS